MIKSNVRLSAFCLVCALLLVMSCRSGHQGKVSYGRPQGGPAGRELAGKKLNQRAAAKELARQAQRKGAKVARTAKARTPVRRRGSVDKDISKVIATARSYRGTPYRYGGTSRIGMDCSGLLCTSFQSINVTLPRNSNDQSQFGSQVRLSDIREGDMVFFGFEKKNQISHVGLVTEVRGRDDIQFIHASTSLGVTENNLNSNYFRSTFIKAVRPRI